MGDSGRLALGRAAYGRRDWPVARDALLAAAGEAPLGADDLFILSDAEWWLGMVDESMASAEAAYRLFLHGGEHRRAAMSALGIAVNLFLRGDVEVGSGWVSRARRILADEPEGVEHGYIAYMLEVEGRLDGDDLDGLIASSRRVHDIGRRHSRPASRPAPVSPRSAAGRAGRRSSWPGGSRPRSSRASIRTPRPLRSLVSGPHRPASASG